jgi:hypothetical protein
MLCECNVFGASFLFSGPYIHMPELHAPPCSMESQIMTLRFAILAFHTKETSRADT